jgi:hypothetical protein
MIEYDLDSEHSILHGQPRSAIEQDDFVKLTKAVDPHIGATGGLAGQAPRVHIDSDKYAANGSAPTSAFQGLVQPDFWR